MILPACGAKRRNHGIRGFEAIAICIINQAQGVTVIEPDTLAKAIQNEARETIDQYQMKESSTKKVG